MGRKAMSDAKVQLRSWKVVVGFDMENLPPWNAVHITRVHPGQSPDLVGMLAGDLVTHVDGAPVTDKTSFRKTIARKRPGDLVSMRIHRTNETLTVMLQLGAQGVAVDFVQRVRRIADGEQLTRRSVDEARAILAPMKLWLGCDFENADGTCTRLCRIFPGEPADLSGLEVNDCVETVRDAPTRNMQEFRKQISQHEPGDVVPFLVRRGEHRHTVHVCLGAKGFTLHELVKLRQLVADGDALVTPSRESQGVSSEPASPRSRLPRDPSSEGSLFAGTNSKASENAEGKRQRSGWFSRLLSCGCGSSSSSSSRRRSTGEGSSIGEGEHKPLTTASLQDLRRHRELEELERKRVEAAAQIQREQREQRMQEQLERQASRANLERAQNMQAQEERAAGLEPGTLSPDPQCPQCRIPGDYLCQTEVYVSCAGLVPSRDGAYSTVYVQSTHEGQFARAGQTDNQLHSHHLTEYGQTEGNSILLKPVALQPSGAYTPFKFTVAMGEGPLLEGAADRAFAVLSMGQLYGALKAPLRVALRTPRNGKALDGAELVVSSKRSTVKYDPAAAAAAAAAASSLHQRTISSMSVSAQVARRHVWKDVVDTDLARSAQAKLDTLVYDFGAEWVLGECGSCCVERVVLLGPADMAGLMDGDRVKSVNGVDTPDMLSVRWQCIQNRPGDTLEMVVERERELFKVFVTIGAMDRNIKDVNALVQVARGEKLEWPICVSPHLAPVKREHALLWKPPTTKSKTAATPSPTLSVSPRHTKASITAGQLQDKAQDLFNNTLTLELGCRADYDADQRCVRLWDIVPGRAASRAGLLEGDVVVAIDDNPTPDIDRLHELVKNLRPGDVTSFTITRPRESAMSVIVVVGAKGFTIEQVAAIKRAASGHIVDSDLLRPPWYVNQDDCAVFVRHFPHPPSGDVLVSGD